MAHTYTRGDMPVPGYLLAEFLGKGGFGEVWKAITPGGVEEALKIISLDGNQGLKEFRAIRLLKRIRHPNLVPIHAFWLKDEEGTILVDTAADNPALAGIRPVELIEAMGLGDKNLHDHLKECRELGLEGVPVKELLHYMEDAARAIDFLNSPTHYLGQRLVAIQHCGIKPENIVLVADSAQVCDFGLARGLDDVATDKRGAGALAYVAPEFISESKPSKGTDQYSLAITYYELRTGQLPFTADTPWAILNVKLQGNLDLSKLPPAEQAVIAKATALNPSERYPTCAEMMSALRAACAEAVATPSVAVARSADSDSGAMAPRQGVPEHAQKRVPRIYTQGDMPVPGYRLVQFLGRGSFGEVWKATAPGRTEVAFRIIGLGDAQELKDFRILRRMKRIRHPNLVRIHALWLKDAEGNIHNEDANITRVQPVSLIMTMDLCTKSLLYYSNECRVQGMGGIPAAELLKAMEDAGRALDFLNSPKHDLGQGQVAIQHGDVKPRNLLLRGNAVQVPVDGVALARAFSKDYTTVVLSAAYDAPEFIRENKPGRWSDQYSLAMTYCDLRSGRLPFRGGALQEMFGHLDEPPDLTMLPEEDRPIVFRALAKNPEERWPSCTEFVNQLRQAAKRSSLPPPPVETKPLEATRPLPPTPEVVPTPVAGQASTVEQPAVEFVPAKGAVPVLGYRLLKQIGRGGFGQVWRAVAPGDTLVAMKLVPLKQEEADPREVRAFQCMRNIRHDHLLPMFDSWQRDDYFIIAMELAERTLLDRLREVQKAGKVGIPYGELIRYLEEAARGIDYLNEKRHFLEDPHRPLGLQHRDIKPENLLLVSGVVKVADFGLAKVIESSQGSNSGVMTVAYAAPEFFNGQTSAQSDQYSLAVSYCQLRGGRLPFGGNAAQITYGHLHLNPDLTMLPEDERSIVQQALAKNPLHRWPNCQAFVQALMQAASGTDLTP